MTVHIFGIRHHGPGSARSLREALDQLQPDAVLIEGPPDADHIIHLAGKANMEPPVSILIYTPTNTQQAVYYPFAVYSPEFQAMKWALANDVHVAFMDLPQTHQMAYHIAEQQRRAKEAESDMPVFTIPELTDNDSGLPETVEVGELVRRDPLGWLGRAAGYHDGERWWEHIIEQRRNDLQGVFEAVLEAMDELRQTAGELNDESEQRREAYMRQTIRKAQRAGYEKIAVVCGAWHGPALVEESPLYQHSKADNATLRNMPKVKVETTWVPWTHGRLSRESGYGAGIESPGWYHHLWTTHDEVVIRWLTKVSHLLREQDLDASTAQVIDTVRLAETLTAIRGYALPGLEEMNEAIQATMVFGASSPMELIHRKLIVGEMLGEIPPETPMVPLQHDLKNTIRRLKGGNKKSGAAYFQQDVIETKLELDLRKDIHLERSYLLHRLRVLGIEWGKLHRGTVANKGTFREEWQLQWQPEYEIRLIEQSIWGNTIYDAASTFVIDLAYKATDLPTLTKLVSTVMNAKLPDAFGKLMEQVKARASVAADVTNMMAALPPLVYVKYGNVRGIDLSNLMDVVDGLIIRINIGLLNACSSLDNEAADSMYKHLIAVHDAILRLHDFDYAKEWHLTLKRLVDSKLVHGLIAGRATRLLLDTNALSVEEAARLMRLAISTATEPPLAAAWVEGFLRDSGLILLHDDELFTVIDRWVASLSEQSFIVLLPLLRRTFATFTGPEQRHIGERIRKPITTNDESSEQIIVSKTFNSEHANAMLPMVAKLLGLT